MVEVGNILEGKVISVMPFGVFVDLGNKQSGLVHISELSSSYVKDINEYVKKGDILKVKVTRIDDAGKISLSAKQAEEPKKPREKKAPRAAHQNARPGDFSWTTKDMGDLSFEDKLSKFKQDSDEKMQILRRSADSKRSGGYSRRGNH